MSDQAKRKCKQQQQQQQGQQHGNPNPNSNPNSNNIGNPNPHDDKNTYVDPFAGTENPAEEYEAMENAKREEELLSDYISFKHVPEKIIRLFPREDTIIEKELKGKKTGAWKHHIQPFDLTYDMNNRKEQKLELGSNSNKLLEPLIDKEERLFRIVNLGKLMSTLYLVLLLL